MSKGHKFTNIPEIPNASPTSSSPARHPLVRPQPAPRNQHRALKRPSLLTIDPRHQHWCAKQPSLLTIAPRHQHWCAKRPSLLTIDPRHQHWCAKRPSLLTIAPRHQQLVRKTAFPAHNRPPTPAASAISKMQPSVRVCVNTTMEAN